MTYSKKVSNAICSAIIDSGIKNTSLLVALSGGADSVALLAALSSIKAEFDLAISAAHFNHMIRGSEADDDERFCRDLCEALGVTLFVMRGDVPAYSNENGLSIETAARIMRYDFLNRICSEHSIPYIAVAHHADDQAESVLLHLIRGSGLSGLCGMKVLNNNIFRPMLKLTKSDIVEYISENNLRFCTDQTNLIPNSARNRLRLELIPYIKQNFNSSFVSAVTSAAELISADENYLSTTAKTALDAARAKGGYLRSKLICLEPPILSRALRLALIENGAPVDVERKHIDSIIKLLSMKTGSALDVPHISAYVSYDLLCFGTPKVCDEYCIPIELDKPLSFPGGTAYATIESIRLPIKFSPYTAYMDASKALEPMVIRTRLNGDRFYPLGSSGSCKLKDYLINKKVPRLSRNMPLVAKADSAMVLYVYGQSVSELVKVSDTTTNVLKIEFDFFHNTLDN